MAISNKRPLLMSIENAIRKSTFVPISKAINLSTEIFGIINDKNEISVFLVKISTEYPSNYDLNIERSLLRNDNALLPDSPFLKQMIGTLEKEFLKENISFDRTPIDLSNPTVECNPQPNGVDICIRIELYLDHRQQRFSYGCI